MKLSPDIVQDIATIALCLEPLADKEGCTTRYVDIEGKPLTDFIIAGINSGKYFRKQTEDVYADSTTPVFKYFVEALENSNVLKSPKTVNFGLLEILFPTAHAVLKRKKNDDVCDSIVELMKAAGTEDVQSLLKAREVAWKTSINPVRREFDGSKYSSSSSPYEMYMRFIDDYEPGISNHEWALQFKLGLPMIRETLDELKKNEVMEALKISFTSLRENFPKVKVGILADMGAAALFIHLAEKYERN